MVPINILIGMDQISPRANFKVSSIDPVNAGKATHITSYLATNSREF